MNAKSKIVKFNNQHIPVYFVGDKPFVAMKTICENIGLQWEAQLKRIKRNHVLNSTACMIKVVAQDNKDREVLAKFSDQRERIEDNRAVARIGWRPCRPVRLQAIRLIQSRKRRFDCDSHIITATVEKIWFYFGRAFGSHHDHRHADGFVASCGASCPRGCSPHEL